MTLWRRHDGYVLRAFLAAFFLALLVFTGIGILWDLSDRLDRILNSTRTLREAGETPWLAVLEYYLIWIPFFWLSVLPIAALVGACVSITWLLRHNELAPLVTAGVPTRRILMPIFIAAVALAGAQVFVREALAPSLSRRSDRLGRLFSNKKPDRMDEVPHFHDPGGGNLSIAAILPGEKRIEDAYVKFTSDPAVEGKRTLYRYPVLDWDATRRVWVATRGGERIDLETFETGANRWGIEPGATAPIAAEPSLLELTFRLNAASGFSSAEIRELVRANPGRPRLELLLQQQQSAPLAPLVLLLLGLPFAMRFDRSRVFRSFVGCVALVASYLFVSALARDLGARGALSPVVAAWFANVVYGALGIALCADMET